MARRIRVRGQVIDLDPQPGVPLVFWKEGTDTVVTIGANDHLEIDAAQITSIGGSNTLAFNDAIGAPDDDDIFMHVITSATESQQYEAGLLGMPGHGVYIHGSGLNKVGAVVTGWLYQA